MMIGLLCLETGNQMIKGDKVFTNPSPIASFDPLTFLEADEALG
jgi:hypothetical protein|tara:strand:+ start:16824 stop:16955 length:132 start_codon:yes stop_codon:yes gene_type:complete